jgi:hypothetical protein
MFVLLLSLLLFELGPALLDPRCSEVSSRVGGTGLVPCEPCTVDVLLVDVLTADADPTTDADVLDPAAVVMTLPSASPEEEEAARDVTVSPESPEDILDLLDLASSVVAPLPSVWPEEEAHGDVAVPSKSPNDLLDPAVAGASLRSTLSGEEESRTVIVLLESLSRSLASCISTSSSVSAAPTHSPTLLELESSDEAGCPARCESRSDSRIPGERKTLSSELSDTLLACRAVASSSGRTMAMLPARSPCMNLDISRRLVDGFAAAMKKKIQMKMR